MGIALFVAASIPAASSGHKGRMLLYVDNSLGDELTVIDMGSFKVVDTIRVGSEPHGLCAAANGRRLFTTIEGEKNLKTIETTTGEILGAVPLTGRPNECAARPMGIMWVCRSATRTAWTSSIPG